MDDLFDILGSLIQGLFQLLILLAFVAPGLFRRILNLMGTGKYEDPEAPTKTPVATPAAPARTPATPTPPAPVRMPSLGARVDKELSGYLGSIEGFATSFRELTRRAREHVEHSMVLQDTASALENTARTLSRQLSEATRASRGDARLLKPAVDAVDQLTRSQRLLGRLIDQRVPERADDVLADADLISASLLVPLRDHFVSHGLAFPVRDPIAAFTDNIKGADLWHYSDLNDRPLVFVPHNFGDELFRYAGLPHEMGHLLLDHLDGLEAELETVAGVRGVRTTLLDVDDGRLVGSLAQPLAAWIDEFLADAFTVLQLGPAGLLAFAHVFERPDDVESILRGPAEGAVYADTAPSHLRMEAALYLLERMGFQVEAKTIGQAWRDAHGEPEHLLIEGVRSWLRIPMSMILPMVQQMMDQIYITQYDALGGMQLQSIPGFEMSPGNWAHAEALAESLRKGVPMRAKPRLVLAAGILARHLYPSDASAISFAMRKSILGDKAHDLHVADVHYDSIGGPRRRTTLPVHSSARQAVKEALVLRELLGPPLALRGRR